jgi:DNA-binding NarL/FixJ family response regulator
MKICVVDDHEIVREGLRTVLPSDPMIEVVAEAASGAEALTAVRRTLPDVVLTDYRLPDMTGDELCRRILALAPSTAVVILTTYLSEDVVQRSIDAGAAGFVTKAAGLEELRGVLGDLARGERRSLEATSAVVQRLHQSAARDADSRTLTPQQERVLELAAAGLTYGEISRKLHVSESTVRFHIQSLKERLGVRTKTELIATAIRSALIAPGQDAS